MTRRWLLFFGLCLVSPTPAACGSKPGPPFASADAGDDATSDAPAFGTDGGGCAVHCSSDLHDVLDCEGTVVRTCPPDAGCGANGQCVAPCDAATANRSTFGCDYYTFPYSIDPAQTCFAAFVANTWDEPVTISVDLGAAQLDASKFARIPSGSGSAMTYAPLPNGQLPPGQVAILFLNQYRTADMGFGPPQANCPAGVETATQAGAIDGTGAGTAFHIGTSAPVVAFDIAPFGGGQSAVTSATLLLPTTAWDTNYVAVNGTERMPPGENYFPWIAVVAKEDGTDVTINPVANIAGGGGVPASSAGQPVTYALSKGEILQIEQPDELTGSPIQSNKPVGVWGGNSCAYLPQGVEACDGMHQQLGPVSSLGSRYVAVRYRDRFDGQAESPPWRLVGAVDGTKLAYSPSTPAGAPTTLAAGQHVDFRAGGPFIVASQDAAHPFYLAAYMTGCFDANHSCQPGDLCDCRGDPEFVNVVPPAEYLSSYVFFTDPTYPETDLVVVRAKGAGGSFSDVTLDCAGVLGGWQQAGGSDYEYARVDLVRHDFQKQGGCDNGRHEIRSDAPFGLTVWGWGSADTGGAYGDADAGGFYTQAVSYAYPGGQSVRPINSVVVPVIK